MQERMSSRGRTTPEQRVAIQAVDDAGMFLVNAAIHTARKNPVKLGIWGFGLMLCLFFNGVSNTVDQIKKYDEATVSADKFTHEIEESFYKMRESEAIYRQSQGWFWACDKACQLNKKDFEAHKKTFETFKGKQQEKLRDAKQAVGIFSKYGVENTRYLFNDQFSRGKRFAKRQTQWDALFMGIQAMGRDESIINYALRVGLSLLFNFTFGVCGALLGFLWNLWGLVVEYRAPLFTAVLFFALASIAAFSFALAWLACMYGAAAGTVYVGAKFIASNMRIQDDASRGGQTRGRLD